MIIMWSDRITTATTVAIISQYINVSKQHVHLKFRKC